MKTLALRLNPKSFTATLCVFVFFLGGGMTFTSSWFFVRVQRAQASNGGPSADFRNVDHQKLILLFFLCVSRFDLETLCVLWVFVACVTLFGALSFVSLCNRQMVNPLQTFARSTLNNS